MLYRKDGPCGRALLFQRCEEWFCDRVIMRLAEWWKRLFRIVFIQDLLETMKGILCASVAMKNKIRRGMALFMRHFECSGDKLRTVPFWNFMCNHFAREKVDDHANIKIVISQFKTSNIADPSFGCCALNCCRRMFFFRSGSRSFKYSCFAVVRTLLKPISGMSREIYPGLTWCPRWMRIIRIFSTPSTCLYSSNASRMSWQYSWRRLSNQVLPRLLCNILYELHISRKTAPVHADDLLMEQMPNNQRISKSW